MICSVHDNLRQEWVAARADYQLALADLQTTPAAQDFREALRHANRTFSEYAAAEAALNEHLHTHRCSKVPVFPPVTNPLQGAA